MQARKNIKKTAGLIGGHVKARENELAPRDKLADQKNYAESRGNRPEFPKLPDVRQR